MGHSRPLFSLFSSFQYTVDRNKCSIYKFFLPMTGFEPRTSGFGSNRSTNWATQPRPIFISPICIAAHPYLYTYLFCTPKFDAKVLTQNTKTFTLKLTPSFEKDREAIIQAIFSLNQGCQTSRENFDQNYHFKITTSQSSKQCHGRDAALSTCLTRRQHYSVWHECIFGRKPPGHDRCLQHHNYAESPTDCEPYSHYP